MKSLVKRTWGEKCAEKRKESEARVESLKAAAGAVVLQPWTPPRVVRVTGRPARTKAVAS